jgi:DNA-binding response OmpR family regulator
MQRLRRKLGDDPRHPRYIHTEWGIGYAFTAPRSSDLMSEV